MRTLLSIPLACLLITGELHAQLTDLAWLRQTTNAAVVDGSILALDPAGNILIAGTYPASGVTIGGITLAGSAAAEGVFLAKMAPDGTALWAKRLTRIGGMQDEQNPDKIAIDAEGNIYLTGWFLNNATIDGTLLPGDADYFLAKFSSAGDLLWTRTAVTEDNIQSSSVAVYIDAQQHVQWVGLFVTSVTLDADHTVANTDQPGLVDAFMAHYTTAGDVLDAHSLGALAEASNPWEPLAPEPYVRAADGSLLRWVGYLNTLLKYDADGTLLFTRTIDMQGNVGMRTITTGPDGSIWMCGYFTDNVVLEGMPFSVTGTNGDPDALIMKLSSTGELLWIRQYGGPVGDYFFRLRVDAIGNATALGAESTTTSLVRSMLVKYDANGDLLSEGSIYPWDGIQDAPYGTMLPHNLVLAHNGGNVLMLGSYTNRLYFNDAFQFTSSANNYRMFLAQFGTCGQDTPVIAASAPGFCPTSSVDITASAAENYLWGTGDTTASITVDEAGAYHVFAITAHECYARSEDVFVSAYAVPQPGITPGDHLLGCTVDDVTYQWIDCADGDPIPGATAQTYAPPANGSYAVRITTSDGCEALSPCATYSTVGIAEPDASLGFALWPNPAVDRVVVRANGTIHRVEVFSASGACVINTRNAALDVSELAPGTYAVRVTTAATVRTTRLVKN